STARPPSQRSPVMNQGEGVDLGPLLPEDSSIRDMRSFLRKHVADPANDLTVKLRPGRADGGRILWIEAKSSHGRLEASLADANAKFTIMHELMHLLLEPPLTPETREWALSHHDDAEFFAGL